MKKPKSDRMVVRRSRRAPDPVVRIDRRGQFPQRADILSILVSRAIGQAHRELRVSVHIADPMILTAMSEQSKSWAMAFKQEPAGVTDVTLENVTATPAELDEIWRIVEVCAQLR
jgi:hypothetical protein